MFLCPLYICINNEALIHLGSRGFIHEQNSYFYLGLKHPFIDVPFSSLPYILCTSGIYFVRSPWHSGEGRRTYFDNCVSQHLSGAGSSPDGSVGRDLNLQKIHYQYLTTSVAVLLVVR